MAAGSRAGSPVGECVCAGVVRLTYDPGTAPAAGLVW